MIADESDVYYTSPDANRVVRPRIHWCFIAEIIADVSVVRPVYSVRDRDGKVTLVALYFDNNVSFDSKYYRVGNTICVMYACKKIFMDGQQGIRVEEPECVQGKNYKYLGIY